MEEKYEIFGLDPLLHGGWTWSLRPQICTFSRYPPCLRTHLLPYPQFIWRDAKACVYLKSVKYMHFPNLLPTRRDGYVNVLSHYTRLPSASLQRWHTKKSLYSVCVWWRRLKNLHKVKGFHVRLTFSFWLLSTYYNFAQVTQLNCQLHIGWLQIVGKLIRYSFLAPFPTDLWCLSFSPSKDASIWETVWVIQLHSLLCFVFCLLLHKRRPGPTYVLFKNVS